MRERDLVVFCPADTSMTIYMYLINTSITITTKMMAITKTAKIPLKTPMTVPQPANGSESPWVVAILIYDVVGVVESPVVTITPAKKYHSS